MSQMGLMFRGTKARPLHPRRCLPQPWEPRRRAAGWQCRHLRQVPKVLSETRGAVGSLPVAEFFLRSSRTLKLLLRCEPLCYPEGVAVLGSLSELPGSGKSWVAFKSLVATGTVRGGLWRGLCQIGRGAGAVGLRCFQMWAVNRGHTS